MFWYRNRLTVTIDSTTWEYHCIHWLQERVWYILFSLWLIFSVLFPSRLEVRFDPFKTYNIRVIPLSKFDNLTSHWKYLKENVSPQKLAADRPIHLFIRTIRSEVHHWGAAFTIFIGIDTMAIESETGKVRIMCRSVARPTLPWNFV